MSRYSIGIIILLSLLLGGYGLFSLSDISLITKRDLIVPDDWAEYSNEQLGLSLSHPNSWSISDNIVKKKSYNGYAYSGQIELSSLDYEGGPESAFGELSPVQGEGLFVTVQDAEFLNREYSDTREYFEYAKSKEYISKEISLVNFNGYDAVLNPESKVPNMPERTQKGFTVLLEGSKYGIYIFSGKRQSLELDIIVSSIKLF